MTRTEVVTHDNKIVKVHIDSAVYVRLNNHVASSSSIVVRDKMFNECFKNKMKVRDSIESELTLSIS